MAAAGIATLAIAALVVLTLGPSWWDNRGVSGGARSRPETDRKLDAWSSEEDGQSSVEDPAAEFRAELYGIVEPLVERLPNSPRARCVLASVHRRFARRAEAARELQHCLALDPTCAEAHYLLGLMALDAGDYPVAERHLRDAFDINPRWADVPLRLAQAQMSRGRFRDAALTLETYLRLDPGEAEAWCLLGQAYQELGDHISAKRCHLTAIRIDPDSVEAHYGVAKASQELGAAEEARECFEVFRRMRHSRTASVRSEKAAWTDENRVRVAIVRTLTEAGTVYAMHGYPAEAEKCWTRATTLDPTHVECQEMLCRLRPNDPEHWLRFGHLCIQGGRPAEAEGPFQRVIKLAPERADGYAALAEVYIRLDKNAEEAFQLAETGVKLESTAHNYFVLAAACERVEDWSGAESALEHAIKLDPAEPRYREALAKLQKVRRP